MTKELLLTRVSQSLTWVNEVSDSIPQTQTNDSTPCHSHSDAFLVALLNGCAKQKDLRKGTRLHADFLKGRASTVLAEKSCVGTALINMYAKCGAIDKAQEVFDELKVRDVVSWSALISGYALHGHGNEALKCFERMQQDNFSPNAVTYAWVLKACSSIGATGRGEAIHAEIMRMGLLKESSMLGTALVDMYAKCGALTKAQEVFDGLPEQNVVTWSVLLAGYAHHGHVDEALVCFEQMQDSGFSPNAITLTSILKACGSIGAAQKGGEIHTEVVKQGLLEKDTILGTALMDMYAKCGALVKAGEMFDRLPARDVVAWSALIAGYAQHGHSREALNCFDRMQEEDIHANAFTFTCVLQACGSLGAADKGGEIHNEVVRCGLLKKNVMLGTALVDMYAKCGAFEQAQQVFDELPVRDLVCWGSLIAGYTRYERGEEALKCFKQMERDGIRSDAATFACILKACGNVGAIEKGEEIHSEVAKKGLLQRSTAIGNALVDMYANFGLLPKAQGVFDELCIRNVATWTALIAGYAQHGCVTEAMNHFEVMHCEGVVPNAVTFAILLNACSHSGLVDDGQKYFKIMFVDYGISPGLEHHTSMVDLFGRAGHLEKTKGIIKEVPPHDCHPLWVSLLSACQKWGYVEFGRLAFENAICLNSKDIAAYISMHNIYAEAGMQDEVVKVEAMRARNEA